MSASDENDSVQTEWVATAYGALDVTSHDSFLDGTDILVVPTIPGVPLALQAEGAALWRKLVSGPVSADELSGDECQIIHEMAEVGLASLDRDHTARVRSVPKPWLSSPIHELVYALVKSVADEHDIPVFFIKGPVLHAQGLREREHSGDVDVWVRSDRYEELTRALEDWGWTVLPFDFADLTYHSFTVQPGEWGCEIDVHFRFPGVGIDEVTAFNEISSHAERYSFAGVSSSAPAPALHAVIQTLHLIRPVPGVPVPESAVTKAVEVLRVGGIDVIEAACELGSLDVIRDLLVVALPGERLPIDGGGIPVDWAWRLQPNRARYHLAVLRSLPWRERPQALRRVLWPTDRTAKLSAARAGDAQATGARAHLVRLRYGLRQLLSPRSDPDEARG